MSEPSSPERRRRGRIAIGVGCGGLVLVLAASIAGYVHIANQLPPVEPDPVVLPSPNGYDAFVAALSADPNIAPGSPLQDPAKSSDQALRREIVKHEGTLASARRAFALPFEVPPEPDPFNPPVGQYEQVRHFLRLLDARSRVAAAYEGPGSVMEYALDSLELGACFGRHGNVMRYLTAGACLSMGARRAEAPVEDLPAEAAAAAAARLERIMARRSPLADVFRATRRVALQGIRSKHRFGLNPSPVERWLGPLYPTSFEYRDAAGAFDALISAAERPYVGRPAPPQARFWSTRVIMPTLHPLGLPAAAGDTALRELRLQLALRQHRLATGGYPSSLADLVPRWVPDVPPDPFTGKPFIYRRTATGYLLYSVGPDGTDDGGAPILLTSLKALSKGDLVAGRLFSRSGGKVPAAATR